MPHTSQDESGEAGGAVSPAAFGRLLLPERKDGLRPRAMVEEGGKHLQEIQMHYILALGAAAVTIVAVLSALGFT